MAPGRGISLSLARKSPVARPCLAGTLQQRRYVAAPASDGTSSGGDG
ncbi:hypothetical protein [Streptomyces sp. NPDC059262]